MSDVASEAVVLEAPESVESDQPNMQITPSAQEYLKELLAKQNTPGIGVRIFVENAGTPRAVLSGVGVYF